MASQPARRHTTYVDENGAIIGSSPGVPYLFRHAMIALPNDPHCYEVLAASIDEQDATHVERRVVVRQHPPGYW